MQPVMWNDFLSNIGFGLHIIQRIDFNCTLVTEFSHWSIGINHETLAKALQLNYTVKRDILGSFTLVLIVNAFLKWFGCKKMRTYHMCLFMAGYDVLGNATWIAKGHHSTFFLVVLPFDISPLRYGRKIIMAKHFSTMLFPTERMQLENEQKITAECDKIYFKK